MACYARLVAEYVVTREEDTITRDHFARLKQHDITHDDILYIDVLLASVSQYLDKITLPVLMVPFEMPGILLIA
jgi:hypothetical protein